MEMGKDYINTLEVTAADIAAAVKNLGVRPGDTVLVHSSLKSMGYVSGGPSAVIQGFEDILGREGTLVMPTLSMVDFKNSYKTWYMDKPSDVGYITEFFRKQIYSYRSNQATHSVAARGKLAYELTCGHTAYGPHLCPFGEYAFSDSSPWMKMYRCDARIVFLGVTMVYNTMKHMIEARYAEDLLSKIKNGKIRDSLKARLTTFDRGGVWPFYDGMKMQNALDSRGLIKRAPCGSAEFLCVSAKDSSDCAFNLLFENPEEWYAGEELDWIKDCIAAAG